jgi:hypothetical protein
MDQLSKAARTLDAAVLKVMRALFRVLLRHSMSYTAFDELARRAYVEVAMKDFAIEGKKPTISRASILSGLTRKEVRRLLSIPADGGAGDGAEGAERYNRAARVITGWVRDADFLDSTGAPRALPFEGAHGFAELVRRHSGDMPARAVLDELHRVGAVHLHEDQHLQLSTRAYVPITSPSDKLEILGLDVQQLIATIDHNIEQGASDPRFQRKVMYESIAQSDLRPFRRYSATHAQALLERFDRWLNARHIAETTAVQGAATDAGPRMRVGVGIYYFEEPTTPQNQGEPK